MSSGTLVSGLSARPKKSSAAAQFTVVDWQFNSSGGGGSGTVTAKEMTIVGPDAGGCPAGGTASFTAVAPIAGTVIVQASWINYDGWDYDFDWPVTVAGSVETQLEEGYSGQLELVLDVKTGSTFGFGSYATDCCCGPVILTLTGFQFFPAPVEDTLDGDMPGEGFGTALAAAGDVDGDGLADLVIGAPNAQLGGTTPGRAALVSGGHLVTLLEVAGDGDLQRFGAAVGAGGDVSGDGVPDFIVGAPYADLQTPTATDAGYARIVSGADGTTLRTIPGEKAFDKCGTAVAGIGDLDGDGVSDFAIGSPFNDKTASSAGQLRVVSGASGAVLLDVQGAHAGDQFGAAVAGTGDIDGDGVPDFIVGAPWADGIVADVGRARLHSGADGSVLWTFGGTQAQSLFGVAVAGAGDVDADGAEDVVVGAPLHPSIYVGQANVYSGGSGAVLYTFTGYGLGAQLGRSAANVGDVDEDGHDDVLIGQPTLLGGTPVAYGSAHVYSGRTGLLAQVVHGEMALEQFGWAVAGLGDLDGDGVPDIAGGSPASDATGVDAGRVQTFRLSVIWADLGHGLVGSSGVPALVGSGIPAAGSQVSLDVSQAKALAPAWLVAGLAGAYSPFKGGVLVPSADLVFALHPVTAAGEIHLDGGWPAGVPPGLDLFLQTWLSDSAGPAGFAASNAVRATVP